MAERLFYNIADHLLELRFMPSQDNSEQLLPSLAPFRVTPTEESDRTTTTDASEPLLTLTVDDALLPVPREQRQRVRRFDTGNGDTIVDHTTGGGYQFIIKDVMGGECCLLQADADFRHCQCALNGTHGMRNFGLNNALMLCFAFASARHDTILLHASTVIKDGWGYAFTAESGTGKSTHASMWLRYLPGCELLNDDNPVVRILQGTPYIYGSPWSGKTPCYRPRRAPLRSIVGIVRDTHNHAEQLDPVNAFSTILQGCSSMRWDQQLFRQTGDVVQHLVEKLPIVAMHCRPDREAAEVCASHFLPRQQTSATTTRQQAPATQPHVAVSPQQLLELPNSKFLPLVIEFIQKGHTAKIPLRGISMRPFLENDRDFAILTAPTNVSVGDAVLAEYAPGQYVLHRLWRIDGDHVTLLGDGNLTPEHCRLADIRAKAVAFYRKGRQRPDLTDGIKWRTYSWLWTRLRPLRRWLLAFNHRILLPLGIEV